jgi:two-component system cell cycle sensor histidine kinase/response regulator CckA
LVSGIAHDLNNTLVPIIIGVEILKMQSLSEDAASMVNTMESSARRSAEMVKQMLLFARGGESVKSLIRPDQLVKEMGKIITDTFPKSVNCRVSAGKNLHGVFAIPTQIHQVLMNLCVNARDAMSEKGTLTLKVENARLSAEEAARQPGARPGEFVCISVGDTGTGIPPEQLGKIFKAFFTTKAPGKGTGLGLSTCQSIVKSHEGFITVHSQVGKGTEFKVYLPATDVKPPEPASEGQAVLPGGKGERILVVDDEGSILAMTRAALENYGYAVTTAVSGMEAVSRFRENPEAFNLVITDYGMPFMDGPAMIPILRKMRPDIKIVMTTGSEDQVKKLTQDSKIDGFVLKPFTTEGLLNITHRVLAGK